MINGIDVSSYQPANFPTAGNGFVFVKATEGQHYVNPEWVAQVAHGRSAGLLVGHYHFARPGSWKADADHFLATVGPHLQRGELLAYDWEVSGIPTADKDAWIRYVQAKAPGHKTLLYTDLDMWKTVDTSSFAGDGLWIADPDAPAGQPKVKDPWRVHQYSDAGGLDRDVAAFASVADLHAWAGTAVPPSLPDVSLSKIIEAAKTDPHAAQGHKTYAAGTNLVEAALEKLKYLAKGRYAGDGSYGTVTVDAYRAFQHWYSEQHHLGWTAAECDGIPGRTSLGALAHLAGTFHVVA